ncbi:hypothetical protein J3L18_12095 [Mucilaginibacter gossypii]|uniref:hypothetical protein n=1 Tax=Mucilaginibacter gossypii TaxID=551996 RepID=UPI000DCE1057|nr:MULTISPECIES: hypothetical protein [Mucilaginibacter]QTE39754.2 hypothetical protein J3L18_12095 [Mucilaginibacter gossypii]RAV58363.1 hypothetical protein DIU36_10340 [Mucilaginibacter rubeus]
MRNFRIDRFLKLFAKYNREHYKEYLMSFMVLLGVLMGGAGVLVFISHVPLGNNMQISAFAIVLFLSGTLFTSNIFSELSSKQKAVAFLTLPASHLEKFIIRWLYSYVFFPIMYVAGFYVVMLILSNLDLKGHGYFDLVNIFKLKEITYIIFSGYTVLHAMALFGAVYFSKAHFVKSAFVFFITVITLILVNRFAMELVTGRPLFSAIPFGPLNFEENKSNVSLHLNQGLMIKFAVLPLVVAVLLWIGAYLRFLEKEI